MEQHLYFRDNFFSVGRTEIYNEAKEMAGELDLKNIFGTAIDVLDLNGEVIISGKFPLFGLKWKVYDRHGQEIGSLKAKFSLFSKKFEYDASDRGSYIINSEAFSKVYEIMDGDQIVARFDKISSFIESSAYRLRNNSSKLSNEELIAVVMGVNAIHKRQRTNSGA
ncbi:hypothetical protein [Mesobacillus subterraneus]|uniref:Uncharacterized protein n=1 Tax=Mesobacillus subterraneus TaxID=285983 RepID=A0A427TM96_9BACI|nr:hypothetical protein [Mesobacillus subterraneus]RSD25480.1 hypothetical protein EJA10_16880 [Mesobacillus subterraneus]